MRRFSVNIMGFPIRGKRRELAAGAGSANAQRAAAHHALARVFGKTTVSKD